MKHVDNVVIVASHRTPIGQYQGCFSTLSAPILASHTIQATLKTAQCDPNRVDEVLMGCVLTAGIGQAPARQSALAAGLPESVGATSINKMCGSGMMAIIMACDALLSGRRKIILAGGMESMSQAPYLLSKARQGYKIGHANLIDHMFLDGLEDAYDKGQLMGNFAQLCATHYGFTRECQDDYALLSLERAQYASANGLFQAEIAPILVQTASGQILILEDELPQKAQPHKIPLLKPAFNEYGTITAANSSSISDGAAVHLLMLESEAQDNHLPYLAKIVGQSSYAASPSWFTTAPIFAIEQLMAKLKWSIDDVDLFEINEAFAVVVLASMRTLNIPLEKINIHGGACALGHPLGASGARIITTLCHALKINGLKRGIAAICIGGGEATALAIEIME